MARLAVRAARRAREDGRCCRRASQLVAGRVAVFGFAERGVCRHCAQLPWYTVMRTVAYREMCAWHAVVGIIGVAEGYMARMAVRAAERAAKRVEGALMSAA